MDNRVKISIKKVLNKCIEESNLNECPDQVIGQCEISNGDFKWIDKWITSDERINKINSCNIENREKSIKNIIIILESPHKEEYRKEIIGPALGTTGININKKFEEKISNVIKNNISFNNIKYKYNVILVNAIQYATSLGFSTTNFRDRIWLDLWINENLRENFIKRIEIYEPSIIINLCTNGSHKENPFNLNQENKKDITQKFLKKIFINNEIDIQKNRGSEKICHNNKCIYNNSLSKITLKMFVQNAISSAIEGKSVYCIVGTHPSSWTENDESEFEFFSQEN